MGRSEALLLEQQIGKKEFRVFFFFVEIIKGRKQSDKLTLVFE